MDTGLLVTQLLNGLQLGVLLFLLASGLTLVFGIMDFVNLAHGAIYMLGAYIAAKLTLALGSFILAVALALPIVAVIGLILERFVARPLYRREHLDHMLATFGLLLVLDSLAQIVWGPDSVSVPLPLWLRGQVTLTSGIELPAYRVVIVASGLVIAAALYWLVNHTRIGMLIRAGASNRTMVSALGINIDLLFAGVFAVGAVLAGLGGMLIAPITDAAINMGNDIIITAFVVIIVGGVGSMKGAFVAAMLVGLIDTMGRSYLDGLLKLFMPLTAAETAAPALAAMLIYILMAAILALRPQGLFPPKTR